MAQGLKYAAGEAEKYGDQSTQANVKKMQYPYATDYWKGMPKGTTDTSLYPDSARDQVARTKANAKRNRKRATK